MSARAASPHPRSLVQINRDLRWQRLVPGFWAIAAIFGGMVSAPPVRYDVDAMWREHLATASEA